LHFGSGFSELVILTMSIYYTNVSLAYILFARYRVNTRRKSNIHSWYIHFTAKLEYLCIQHEIGYWQLRRVATPRYVNFRLAQKLRWIPLRKVLRDRVHNLGNSTRVTADRIIIMTRHRMIDSEVMLTDQFRIYS